VGMVKWLWRHAPECRHDRNIRGHNFRPPQFHHGKAPKFGPRPALVKFGG
jgi:hypothetical protein